MIRGGLPFGMMMVILVSLWAMFAVVINVYAPKLRWQHLKITLRALGAAVISLIIIIAIINGIAIWFN